jgi:hypothetical protein
VGRKRGRTINATRDLHKVGRSLWLDNITRAMLNDGTLESYDYSVTGLTSNPAIFDKAIDNVFIKIPGTAEGARAIDESWKKPPRHHRGQAVMIGSVAAHRQVGGRQPDQHTARSAGTLI